MKKSLKKLKKNKPALSSTHSRKKSSILLSTKKNDDLDIIKEAENISNMWQKRQENLDSHIKI